MLDIFNEYEIAKLKLSVCQVILELRSSDSVPEVANLIGDALNICAYYIHGDTSIHSPDLSLNTSYEYIKEKAGKETWFKDLAESRELIERLQKAYPQVPRFDWNEVRKLCSCVEQLIIYIESCELNSYDESSKRVQKIFDEYNIPQQCRDSIMELLPASIGIMDDKMLEYTVLMTYNKFFI